MMIDGKIPEGYVLLCDRCGEAFVARWLGPSVECKHCGHTELPAAMVTDYLLRNQTRAKIRAMRDHLTIARAGLSLAELAK